MPEYRIPGVYVEETSFRPRAIQGVATSTVGLVGPALDGPTDGVSEALTSFADFEQAFGGLGPLSFTDEPPSPNYLAHGVRAFFEEGGERCHVARVAGTDGARPRAPDYEGEGTAQPSGLAALAAVDAIAVVAAPGCSAGYLDDPGRQGDVLTTQSHLVQHAERLRHRIALLDAPDGATVADVRAFRAHVDSSHAALYYPWVTISDPASGDPLSLPPSGFVAGVYARTDAKRGVHKAPANEVVRLATGLETTLTNAQQEVLNPEGINALRHFPSRGYRVWGARTASSDPEYRYVNVRRLLSYLEHSIERGTRWAVFEPNDEPLWASVREGVEAFLFSEWRGGRLQGAKPEEAYFVRCDRTTMTQTDLDAGRLVALVGVAPVRPAEFVTVRVRHLAQPTP
jgi:phage tail sheath protein FI